MRSTAIRWNFREYRFRFTLQFLSLQSVPSELSQFKGSVQRIMSDSGRKSWWHFPENSRRFGRMAFTYRLAITPVYPARV
jgi:hypothetical protein